MFCMARTVQFTPILASRFTPLNVCETTGSRPYHDELLWVGSTGGSRPDHTHLDLNRAPYALYGVKYIDPVSLW